ncbi:hypothetical protein EP47_04900 [Legionella norrlandica]|uniref:Flagellar biosynthesis protein FlgN n=1 Tax=Legionella norrlandica TaxID=1498499 RepID=A0A0A2SW73_9GAMM|nr:hypothetical protein [Legionella norrlandica]KGP63704.1 hypothetical protein EP47_04900 [Legionella norrlandica]
MSLDHQILEEIINCIERLNEHLKNDAVYYKKRQYEQIEQSNVEKLMLKAKLDSLIKDVIKNKELLSQYTELWETMIMQVKINSDLLAINNKIVTNNLNYYDQLVTQLMKTKNPIPSTYNKLAHTE